MYMDTTCDVCTILPKNNYVLLESDYWVVSLAADQSWLGRSYITAKQHTSSLSDLSTEQWDDLHHVIQRYEHAVTSAFQADLFNWACLMNDAFKEPHHPQSPHVHFHVRPRYKNPVTLSGIVFTDEEFGKHYKTRWDGKTDKIVDDTSMRGITQTICSHMS